MQAIVLVHGIMGAKLQLGAEEIWPPSLPELLSHYKRIAKLRDLRAVATDIIYQYTSLVQIYGPIINDIDAIIAAQGGRRPDFWYDWRLDFSKSADALAQVIASNCSGPNPATEVTIVAHSMGGLVARTLLESGKYNPQRWFSRIKKLVTICVPQVGAPLAVGRALGLEGSTSILPQDMKLLMNDPNLPAGSELFPAPPYRKSVLFDVNSGGWDIYAGNTAAKFQLSPQNQAAALAAWSKVDFNKRPSGVKYISIAAHGLSTENAYYFNNTVFVSNTSVDGDGTVPYWSASFGPVDQLITLPGDHIKVMNTAAFRQAFGKIFGVPLAITPYVMDRPGISISTNKTDLNAGERLEVLLIPDARTTELDGKLVIEKAALTADGKGMNLLPGGANISVRYSGPAIASLPLVIAVPDEPGAYVLRFEGTHRSSNQTSAAFFVRDSLEAAPNFSMPERAKGKPKRKKAAKKKR